MRAPVHVPGLPVDLRGGTPRSPLSPFAAVHTAPFVGSDLVATPASSAFGTLVRVIRVNELPPVALASLFGIRTRRADDLSAVMTFSEARQVALARALDLPEVPPEWNLSTWFPFKGPSTLLSPGWAFRHCPACLHAGYHTPLHQLPWIDTCPWHHRPLLEGCGACGRRVPTDADWVVGASLRCECGHMPLDTEAALYALQPPEGAAAYLHEYRQWAASARATSELVVPERAGDPRPALAALVRLPTPLRTAKTGVVDGPPPGRRRAPHVRTSAAASSGPIPDREGLLRLEELRQDRPGFLSTPERLAPALTAVAARLALRLPAKSLTDGEMTLFLAGTGIEAPESFEPAARVFSPEVSMLPPTRVGERHFLNLTCLHPAAYRAVPRLLDAVFDGRTPFDFYAQATPEEFDVVMRACQAVLARGYAEGLRATVATHVPEIYALPRDAPRLTVPWVLVRREGGHVTSVRTAWTPLAYEAMGEAAVLTAEDEANRRRQRAGRRTRSGK